MKVFLLMCLVGFATCNPPSDLDVIVQLVIGDTDIDRDGVITVDEFKKELLAKWDSDVPSDERVSKHDFVNKWTSTYHDNHHHASQFFDRLDTFFPFGELTEADLLLHMKSLDPNGDSVITDAEFGNFIKQMHPCQAHGRLHC